MARLVRGNVSTNTGLNLINIRLETGLCPWLATSREVKDILTLNESSGYKEGWKCHLLERYLEIRRRQRLELDNTEYIDQLILSICTS